MTLGVLRYRDSDCTLATVTAAMREAPDPTNVAIATAVTHLLDDRGVTVDQLAVYAGLNRSSLYKKIKGEFGWKATDVAALSRYFGVQPNDLFSGSPVGGMVDEDVKRPTLVRHQGLEPRTRWFEASALADVVPLEDYRRRRAPAA